MAYVNAYSCTWYANNECYAEGTKSQTCDQSTIHKVTVYILWRTWHLKNQSLYGCLYIVMEHNELYNKSYECWVHTKFYKSRINNEITSKSTLYSFNKSFLPSIVKTMIKCFFIIYLSWLKWSAWKCILLTVSWWIA